MNPLNDASAAGPMEETGNRKQLDRIIKLLANLKVRIPADLVSEDDFLDHLEVALATRVGPGNYPGTEPPEEAQPPISMSLDDARSKKAVNRGQRKALVKAATAQRVDDFFKMLPGSRRA